MGVGRVDEIAVDVEVAQVEIDLGIFDKATISGQDGEGASHGQQAGKQVSCGCAHCLCLLFLFKPKPSAATCKRRRPGNSLWGIRWKRCEAMVRRGEGVNQFVTAGIGR
ncbi:hypothetical protein D3C78_1341970 [compost metagenome]